MQRTDCLAGDRPFSVSGFGFEAHYSNQ